MGFASEWLERNALFPAKIKEAPDKQTAIIIVVPAFNEPDITSLLDSLAACSEPDCNTEVIIVINAPVNSSEESIRNNKLCIRNIESWKKVHKKCFFRLFYFDAGDHGIKDWGAGLSRKAGMDEAVRRFDAVDSPAGVIVALDADCTVESNYFTEICDNLFKKKEHKACSIYFEHPLSGEAFPEIIYRYITLYELHLRYYLRCLVYTGFPYAVHTVGSCMACKALPYIKSGGMNRKQAGEDFYFIQKLIPAGGYFTLNSTTVYPSPRLSMRVPFGTGATLSRMMDNNEESLLTYNIKAFRDLQLIFQNVKDYFHFSSRELEGFYSNLPWSVRSFMKKEEWTDTLMQIQDNTAGEESFRKRFFMWFNMFRIVKYLNYVHAGIYDKLPVTAAGREYLILAGQNIESDDARTLLKVFRKIEKQQFSYSSC